MFLETHGYWLLIDYSFPLYGMCGVSAMKIDMEEIARKKKKLDWKKKYNILHLYILLRGVTSSSKDILFDY